VFHQRLGVQRIAGERFLLADGFDLIGFLNRVLVSPTKVRNEGQT
jgi:hypothetical protein